MNGVQGRPQQEMNSEWQNSVEVIIPTYSILPYTLIYLLNICVTRDSTSVLSFEIIALVSIRRWVSVRGTIDQVDIFINYVYCVSEHCDFCHRLNLQHR